MVVVLNRLTKKCFRGYAETNLLIFLVNIHYVNTHDLFFEFHSSYEFHSE